MNLFNFWMRIKNAGPRKPLLGISYHANTQIRQPGEQAENHDGFLFVPQKWPQCRKPLTTMMWALSILYYQWEASH